jgi:HD-like signal output (HDOD) protein
LDIFTLLDDDSSLVSFPRVYTQFQEAMSDENTSFSEIGDIIVYDAGLSARLLRIVNSAYYGFPQKIETISHAIGVIGTRQLSDLMLSTIVIDKFKSIPESMINMESFWQHSIACGLIARELASQKENLDPEKFFTAGMLHDIGQIILCMKLPQLSLRVLLELQSRQEPLHELEREELGFDHAELGGKLLNKWNLSEFHAETTTFHHEPANAPNYSMETSIIYLADILANTMKWGCSGESKIPSILDENVWEIVQLPDRLSLSDLKEKIQASYDETVNLFLQKA